MPNIGISELIIISIIVILTSALPIANLVFILLTYRKVARLEQILGKAP